MRLGTCFFFFVQFKKRTLLLKGARAGWVGRNGAGGGGEIGEHRTPGVPEAPRDRGIPGSLEVPGTHGAARASGALGAPGAPEAPELFQLPKGPKIRGPFSGPTTNPFSGPKSGPKSGTITWAKVFCIRFTS